MRDEAGVQGLHHHLAHKLQIRLPRLRRERRQVHEQHWKPVAVIERLGTAGVRTVPDEGLFLLGVVIQQPARHGFLPRCWWRRVGHAGEFTRCQLS
jgi:hypothetical protein